MRELREYLGRQSSGPLTDVETLQRLLQECWHQFSGNGDTNMESSKLSGRMEKPHWHKPVLEFQIERHGGTVIGSSRAEIHAWRLDINACTAEWRRQTWRQVSPMEKRLNVRPIADELAKKIMSGADDPRLKWGSDGCVTLRIGMVLPEGSAVQQTLAGQRSRLRQRLQENLAVFDWRMVRPNVFVPPPID